MIVWLALVPALAACVQAADVYDAPFATAARAAPRAVLRVSRSHGLWNFLCALTSRQDWDQRDLGELFDKSRFNTPELRNDFHRYKPACDEPGLWRDITVAAAKSRDMQDFRRKLRRVMPKPRDAQIMREVLSDFEPAYEELVWRPSLDKVRAFQDQLAELSRKTDFAALHAKAAAFFQAKNDAPLLIALAPVPGGHGGRQPLLGDVFSLEMPIDEDTLSEEQLASSYGVIFHEMCHLLDDRRPKKLARLREAIAGSGLHGLLDEPLALNAGIWAEVKVTGKEKDWWKDCGYDQRTCGLAKALQGRIRAYLDAGKPMDEDFLRFAREQYDLLPLPPQ
ncbi:MAG: hypothetical protein NTY77_09215 [Elusimicrobia bacterium]|nr:hypothetical protein [Elusimicrobiota bacterium]